MSSLSGASKGTPSRLVRTVTIDGWLAEAGAGDVALTKIGVEAPLIAGPK